jgi:hypothetical protein
MMMGPWGQHYERTETWWEQVGAWHQYLARCQFLLRQGQFVADICYLQAETPPQGPGDHPRRGYDWDECGAEAVLTRMAAKDGRIVLPDGMNYRVLVLPAAKTMTPPLLARIRALVEAGATIIGAPPEHSPSLNDYPRCDEEIKELAAQIWADCDGVKVKERRLGQGHVVWQTEPEKFLRASGLAPDFASDEPLRHIHRAAGDTDLYFVANPAPRRIATTASFRVSGKAPELWWPESGQREPAPVWQARGGVTAVSLALEPSGSVFVVFRAPSAGLDPVVSLARDDKALLSATTKPPPPVEVTRAVYGVPNDAARTRDAREQVQRLVDAGETTFQVARLAEGGDPAPNVVKTLTVDYTIQGKHYTVKGTDPGQVHLTPEAVKVTVLKARYGVLDDPPRTRDVRDKAQMLVDAGETSFVVARMAEGDDPAFGVVKTLELEYTRNGEHFTARATDPETIDLRPLMLQQAPRVAEVHGAAGGRVRLTAFEPGSYVLQTASGKRRGHSITPLPAPQEIAGPWEVQFAPGLGAPPTVRFDRLVSWTARPEPGVKYFSGAATYRSTFQLPREFLALGRRVVLDLGRVEVMAEAKLNGKDLGSLWKPPFRLDLTSAAVAGENQLEVRVVNLWPNRLVGDEQLPEDSERNPDGTLKAWPKWLLEGKPSPAGRVAFVTWRLWKKNDPLLESGLLGPVTVSVGEEVEL